MSLQIRHFYRFGEFSVDTDQRVLLREGKPVALTPKVFDTLLILLENNGRIVQKEELMNRLWPDTFVEEANLTFNVKQLRKSLGDDARNPLYIETVARRGYRFIASVEELLSEGARTGEQITQRFETVETQSGDSGNELLGEIAAATPEPSSQVTNEDDALSPPQNFTALPAAGGPATGLSKRTVGVLGAIVIVVAGLGLGFWKFATGANRNDRESKKLDGKALVISSLKLEKLTGTGQSRCVAISANGRYLAYTRAFEQRMSVWLRQLAANTNVEIVPATGPYPIYGLAFANSGEYLYFVRGDPTALYRVSLLGGVPTKIVDRLEGGFSVSSDDRQIAFVRNVINGDGRVQYSLMIVNADGTGERTLLAQTYPDSLDFPVWSPDDRSILCAYGSSSGGSQSVSIIEVRIADGSKRELFSDRFFHIGKMAWLPHKSELIIAARKNAQDNKELWRVSYPSAEISQITEGLSAYLDLSVAADADRAVASQTTRFSDLWVGSGHDPRGLKKITQGMYEFCWTTRGRLIYGSTASGNRDLWIMQADGTEQRQLTNDPAFHKSPAVTPDNRYVVFTSNRTGAFQIWRMNLDGSNQIQLTDGVSKDYPSISPDGKWVLYNTTEDWHLWKVAIDGGEPINLTQYPASFPAVSPDGKTIACLGRSEPKRQLSLVLLPFAGGPPLKRLDFAGGGFSHTRIQWTADGKALLYAIERNGPTALIRQPLDGSSHTEAMDFEEDELFDFGYSVDGQSLAVTRGGWQHDVVLISDLGRN